MTGTVATTTLAVVVAATGSAAAVAAGVGATSGGQVRRGIGGGVVASAPAGVGITTPVSGRKVLVGAVGVTGTGGTSGMAGPRVAVGRKEVESIADGGVGDSKVAAAAVAEVGKVIAVAGVAVVAGIIAGVPVVGRKVMVGLTVSVASGRAQARGRVVVVVRTGLRVEVVGQEVELVPGRGSGGAEDSIVGVFTEEEVRP